MLAKLDAISLKASKLPLPSIPILEVRQEVSQIPDHFLQLNIRFSIHGLTSSRTHKLTCWWVRKQFSRSILLHFPVPTHPIDPFGPPSNAFRPIFRIWRTNHHL